jgi:hypothetical protein
MCRANAEAGGRDDRIVRTPRMTLQKSKRSGKGAVPVAIEIRATVPAASVRRRLLGCRGQRRVRNDEVDRSN